MKEAPEAQSGGRQTDKPGKGRKLPAPRISVNVWKALKEEICLLYKTTPLKELRDILVQDRGVPSTLTERQLNHLLNKWTIRKYKKRDKGADASGRVGKRPRRPKKPARPPTPPPQASINVILDSFRAPCEPAEQADEPESEADSDPESPSSGCSPSELWTRAATPSTRNDSILDAPLPPKTSSSPSSFDTVTRLSHAAAQLSALALDDDAALHTIERVEELRRSVKGHGGEPHKKKDHSIQAPTVTVDEEKETNHNRAGHSSMLDQEVPDKVERGLVLTSLHIQDLVRPCLDWCCEQLRQLQRTQHRGVPMPQIPDGPPTVAMWRRVLQLDCSLWGCWRRQQAPEWAELMLGASIRAEDVLLALCWFTMGFSSLYAANLAKSGDADTEDEDEDETSDEEDVMDSDELENDSRHNGKTNAYNDEESSDGGGQSPPTREVDDASGLVEGALVGLEALRALTDDDLLFRLGALLDVMNTLVEPRPEHKLFRDAAVVPVTRYVESVLGVNLGPPVTAA